MRRTNFELVAIDVAKEVRYPRRRTGALDLEGSEDDYRAGARGYIFFLTSKQ
jgi:hypothetical protein